jgi:predicted molibdopterin-dependent oxidoreductase YjgC
MDEIAKVVPAYAACGYEVLPAEGHRVVQGEARLRLTPAAEGAAVV